MFLDPLALGGLGLEDGLLALTARGFELFRQLEDQRDQVGLLHARDGADLFIVGHRHSLYLCAPCSAGFPSVVPRTFAR